jgi:SAM-dependent methyltransferase
VAYTRLVIVNRDERRGRATSFASVAAEYERARPGYPEEAVRWLVGDEPLDVVDLGAGTGKLTRGLVALGHRVTAVEPLREMLAELRRAVPAAQPAEGSAELIPLPAAAADVVVAAQAFHWFDHGAALPEIARVLRPGGVLALVWNMRDDREPWVARLSAKIGGETVEEWGDVTLPVAQSGLFGPLERATFDWAQPVDRMRLRELVLSRSYCATRPPEEREEVLAEVDAIYDDAAGPEGLELPYVTECFRAARR